MMMMMIIIIIIIIIVILILRQCFLQYTSATVNLTLYTLYDIASNSDIAPLFVHRNLWQYIEGG